MHVFWLICSGSLEIQFCIFLFNLFIGTRENLVQMPSSLIPVSVYSTSAFAKNKFIFQGQRRVEEN